MVNFKSNIESTVVFPSITNNNNCILIIMGIVVFSSFSSLLVMDILGSPISIPELLFIPFVLLLRKKYNFTHPGNHRTVVFILFWALLLLISFLTNNYSANTVIASSRPYLLIIFAYLFFSRHNSVSLNDVMFVSLGSLIGWLISSVYGIIIFIKEGNNDIAVTGNMLAIALFISIASLNKKYKWLALGIIICVLISLTAGMRRQIFIFIVTLIITYLFVSIRTTNRFIKQTLLFVFFIILAMLFMPSIKNSIEKNIPVLYYRVFEKTEMFLSGNVSEADNIRLTEIKNLGDNLTKYITPKGFISRRTVIDNTGKYIDFPLAEIFYVFGIPIAFLLFLWFIVSNYFCFKNSIYINNEGIITVILSVIIFILLFLEGTFLSSTYVAPFTGYCLGKLQYYSGITYSWNNSTYSTNEHK